MKYGLLAHYENEKIVNVGDYIQSLAARQFLPRVDELLDREGLASYDGEPIKVIMNGWFTHNVENWIPSERIWPLFISFHINSSAAPDMLDAKGMAYLKKHEPIGCRDQFTFRLLKDRGIKAYFSGCLTLTLEGYEVPQSRRSDIIYVVDPLCNYPNVLSLLRDWRHLARRILNGDVLELRRRSQLMKRIFTRELLKVAKFETQRLLAVKSSEEENFKIADSLLKKLARAKLVVTSRIHCALPCLAMGTPVVFINGFDSFIDTCRFDGIINLFNRVDVDCAGTVQANFELPGKIDVHTNVTNGTGHKILAEQLKEKCKSFVAQTE